MREIAQLQCATLLGAVALTFKTVIIMYLHPSKPIAVHTWDWKEQPDWNSISETLTQFHEIAGKSSIHYIESGSDEHAIVIAADNIDEETRNAAYSQYFEWEEGIDHSEIDWGVAKASIVLAGHKSIESGISGVDRIEKVINPLLRRYHSGDRSKQLFDEIMAVVP